MCPAYLRRQRQPVSGTCTITETAEPQQKSPPKPSVRRIITQFNAFANVNISAGLLATRDELTTSTALRRQTSARDRGPGPLTPKLSYSPTNPNEDALPVPPN